MVNSLPALKRWMDAVESCQDVALIHATESLSHEFVQASPPDAAEIMKKISPFLDDNRGNVQWAAICVLLDKSPTEAPNLPGFVNLSVADQFGNILFHCRWTPKKTYDAHATPKPSG